MDYKTTDEHFNIFKEEAEYWIKELGLADWRVFFAHEDNEIGAGLACCKTNQQGRVACLCLDTEWNVSITEEELKKTAIHEVGELLLNRLEWLAKERCASPEEIREEMHAVIRRLEHVLIGVKKRVA